MAFGAALLCGVGATVGLWTSAGDTTIGLAIAGCLGGIGVGLVAWSRSLATDHEVVQGREDLTTSADDRAAFDEEADRTGRTLGRRPLLGYLLGGAVAALTAAVLSPLRFLGPAPAGERRSTSWTAGRRVVTSEGRPVRAGDGPFDQLATVFPEGHTDADDSQVVLVRIRPELLSPETVQGGSVDGWVAYSKICTHAGCSVGLFGIDDRSPEVTRQLVCPCHQSVFDPADAARPIGGPAPRSAAPAAVGDRRRRSPDRRRRLLDARRPRRLGRRLMAATHWGRRGGEGIVDRLGAGHGVNKALRKVFPRHFSFLWGELALYSFVVLLLSGIYLTLFFQGSQEVTTYAGSYAPLQGAEVSRAYDSVLHITFDVRAGRLIRQTHHWAALVFVASIVLHLARVYFTGAFRKPREPNWVVGCTLLVLALGAGFTGYSLPDDLLSGTGLRIANSIVLSIPVIGEHLAYLVFGGDWPGQGIIARIYPVHILVIPGLIIGLLGAHLGMVWRQKHTQFPGPGRTESNVVGEPVWPGFAMNSIGLLFLTASVVVAMGSIFAINPVWLYGPYEPAAATSFAQPDWYIGFLEGALRIFPPWETRAFGRTIPNPFFPGVLGASVIFAALFAVPWIERRFTGDADTHHLLDRPRDAPRRTASGVAGLAFVVILFIAGAQDVVANTLRVSVGHVTTGLQFALVIVPPISWFAAHRICRALSRRASPEHTERRVTITRTPSGGYTDDHLDHADPYGPRATEVR